ncbi:MAG: putative phage abortive infection protein [Crocinitomicaceae bacterium]|nr:putative phage abortive infection protein [Crocinitomicaceae bacterium]
MKTTDKILIGVAIFTIILGLGHPFIIKYLILSDKSFQELGTVGDWFGGLSGPLIGLSSFILVYLAFRLQGEQNRQQQIEFDKQNKILSLQRFESSFFQLLTFHNEIVQALWVDYNYVSKREKLKRKKEGGKEGEMEEYIKETTEGEQSDKREYFSTVYLMMQHNLKEINLKSVGLSKEMKSSLSYKESVAIENYSTVYNKEQASLGHYFRHLYHIVKYIHKSDLITDEQKKHYAALLRAQLSAYELVLLLYNCLVEDLGYPKFKYLVDKYDMLQNMNGKLLLDQADLEVFKSKKLTEDCLNED